MEKTHKQQTGKQMIAFISVKTSPWCMVMLSHKTNIYKHQNVLKNSVENTSVIILSCTLGV